ncbi:MAG: hypothetical protein IJQ31_00305 [Thermoguttaceae bacterium]|nr:hypothetical protein [Thermoguttaceae bacterium]
MLHTSVSTRRSGMVLLIVMVLLSMVGLTAVTFLMTTSQLKEAANQNRRLGEITVDPEAMLQDGIMTIIRGTNNSNSAVYQNSLLEDMYGTSAEYANPSAEFTGNWGTSNGMITITGGQSKYAGCVITCVDEESPAYRRSTVVLKYQDGQMYCLPFHDGATFTGSAKFIVNSLPYQQELHDYDALDDNNKYLAGRDSNGRVLSNYYSFRNATSPISGTVDADNDGYADSKWLDLGMPVFTYKDGTRFKPLFGVVIEDMDGKLNVNAAGNWPSDNASSSDHYGMGRGAAEIAWEKTLADFPNGSTCAKSLFNARLSANYTSVSTTAGGEKPEHIVTYNTRGPWYADFSSTASLNQTTGAADPHVQRVPHDVLGKWHISVTDGDPSFSSKTLTGQSIGGASGNTYDRDLGLTHPAGIYSGNGAGVNTGTDMPFSPMELEALFRPYDFDAPFLPQRLKRILFGTGSNMPDNFTKLAHLITTESWDLPISKKLDTLSNTESVLPEVVAGWQIDLLRAAAFTLQDDPWDNAKHCYPKRQQFMQSIYEIMRDQSLDPGGSGDTVEKRRAQWAANVVDFMDVDSAMTPFKPMGADFTVFGCEQPELLITETLAIHSRNTEPNAELGDELQVGGYGFDENGNPVKGPQSQTDTNIYENYKEPFTKNKYPVVDADGKVQTDADGHELQVTDATETSIKNKLNELNSKGIEPDGIVDWDQYLRPQGALFVQLYSPMNPSGSPTVENDIYKSGSHEVDISKTAGNNPVWRLVVTDDYNIGDEEHNLKRDTATWPQTGNTGDCFAYHIRLVLSFNKSTSYQPAPDLTSSSNKQYFTFYPKENPTITPSGTLLIGPSGQTVFQFNKNTKAGDITTNNGIQKSLTFNGNTFSSIGGLGSGNAMSVEPLTGSQQTFARFSLTEPRFNVGTSGDYYGPDTSLLLSANDLSPESPLDLEVDSTWKLFSKNSNVAQILKRYGTDTQNRCIVHLQRLADPTRAWENNYNPYITVDSMIVDLTVMNARITSEIEKDQNKTQVMTGNNPTNIFSQQRNNSYVWEQNSKKDAAVSNTAPKFGQVPAGSRPWLGWINTTPVSPFQLMNVTNRCSSELMYHFKGAGSGEGLANTYGYLPDYTSGNLRKIIGFFRVPTPQIVSPMVLNPYYLNSGSVTQDLPAAYYTMYREPGKINLNTANELVLKSLLNTNGAVTKSQSTFRSIIQAPQNSILNSSKFQITAAGSTSTTTNVSDISNRLDYYQYANLTTPRSNVFAVWLTMGFFEVDGSDNVTSVELGSNSGERKRYRAFYMIDRTIPVAFEKGKNHNADQVIILKRMLQ